MALTKVINDLADLNQSDTTNALKGCAGTTAQQPASSSSIDYLIVGGGGGGGGGKENSWGGGGGGAGGYLTGSTTVYHGTPTVITVGEGGDGNNVRTAPGFNGDDSGFNGIRAIGGGGGGAESIDAVDGASGGGAGGNLSGTASQPGSSVSGQGNAGGGVASPVNGAASGGGGGGAVGLIPSTSSIGGAGGIGVDQTGFISVVNANLAQIGDTSNATEVRISGGGGGASDFQVTGTGGAGGLGGGGDGGTDGSATNGDGFDGMTNTGGGGGGGNAKPAPPTANYMGGTGGSGVAVLKYDNTIVTGYTLNSEDTYTVNWPADMFGMAYWPLNLDVKDVGGNYDGTATDITYTNGQFNQAASFNGSSSYIDTTFYVPPTSSLSSSVWFKTSSSAYRHCLFSDFNASGADWSARFSLFVNASNNFEVIFGDGSTDDIWNSISASSYLDGNWHNVVLTANGTALKLYVDGSLIGTDTFLVPVGTAGAQSMVLGRIGDYTGGYWNGQLEQMRFYGSELYLTDVQDIYNNSKPGSLPPLKTSSDLTTAEMSFPSGATTTALWDFNGDSVADPITYDGVDTSMSYIAGKFGSCASFSGSGFIKPAQQPTLSGGFSYSAWIKFTGTGLMSLIGTGGTYGNYTAGLNFWVYNGKLYLSWGDGGSEDSMSPVPSTLINTGEWVHVVATTSGTSGGYTVKAYVNGILDGEDHSTQTIDTTTYAADFTIGAKNFGCPTSCATYYYYTGEMDQLRIYNTELTAQQVYDLWQKENDIQTYITNTTSSTDANGTPANTDILVFKEGSGEITFKNDSPPGGEVGMLRYNSTLGQMEHFNSGGWKDFTKCTTYICNYPVTASALYQFTNNCNDTCGNYNGTPNNLEPYTASGKYGKGAVFNGTNSNIELASTLPGQTGATAFSWSIWFYANGAQSTYSLILDTEYGSSPYNGVGMGIIGSTSTVSAFAGGTTNPGNMAYSGNTYTANVWNHLVLTYDGSGVMKLYLNNVEVGSGSNVTVNTGLSIYVGSRRAVSSWHYFKGTLDQLRIFDSALTSTQITELYNEVYCP